MAKIYSEGSKLIIEDAKNRVIDLKHFIGDILPLSDGRILVRFGIKGEQTPDRNIVCLDQSGKELWRVEDPDMWRVGRTFPTRDLYGGIGFDSEGNLWASGRESRYRIDVNTGKILEEIYTK